MTTQYNDELATLLKTAEEAPASESTFDDGAHFRIEIPSVESPAAFEAVVDQARIEGVTVNRVSQGGGIALLRDTEIRDMAQIGRDTGIEVCLFVSQRAPWNGSAASLTPDGGQVGWRHTRVSDLAHAFDEVTRACELGIRSFLIADEGLIQLISMARAAGDLPAELVVKASAMLGIANPLGGRLLEAAGSNTLNVLSDTAIGELAAFRHLCRIPLDLYIEGPDSLGGFLRYHEISDIVSAAAPIYLKFGLKNVPSLYPSGMHLQQLQDTSTRERVRRAALGVEALERSGASFIQTAALSSVAS